MTVWKACQMCGSPILRGSRLARRWRGRTRCFLIQALMLSMVEERVPLPQGRRGTVRWARRVDPPLVLFQQDPLLFRHLPCSSKQHHRALTLNPLFKKHLQLRDPLSPDLLSLQRCHQIQSCLIQLLFPCPQRGVLLPTRTTQSTPHRSILLSQLRRIATQAIRLLSQSTKIAHHYQT
jgi:hypothetical protein